ncbi:hypothetical protein [Xanthomonas populi]|uniref:hypothetical protein n=1 Tax=Xanthomonas populi TaxID=53414 RepID=UPI001FC9CD62|nr:hypothetical protein [Xanthomonas populi]
MNSSRSMLVTGLLVVRPGVEIRLPVTVMVSSVAASLAGAFCAIAADDRAALLTPMTSAKTTASRSLLDFKFISSLSK